MSEANGGGPHERTVGPVAWYVQHHPWGPLGPFWHRAEAEYWAGLKGREGDPPPSIHALHDAAELDRLRADNTRLRLKVNALLDAMSEHTSRAAVRRIVRAVREATPNAEVSGPSRGQTHEP